MHNLFKLLPVIAFFIVHLTASADSCRYASNRFHIGLDISDPFKMAFADKGTRVRTFEATLRYHASWLVVL